MKITKILMAMALCVAMVLCFAACGDTEPQATEPSTTEPVTTTQAEVSPNPTYTVKVVDETGKPVQGVWVQLCTESCLPGQTNEEGLAIFKVMEADYKVSFTMIPDGYENRSGVEEFHFDAGSYELELTLTAVKG